MVMFSESIQLFIVCIVFLIVFTGYYIDNALECRVKYLLLVHFLNIIKLFFQEFCVRFFPQ